MTAAAILAVTGCSLIQKPGADIAGGGPIVRHIEVEVEDLERGLPCRVIDRRPPNSRDILWRAEFEAGFCHRKAEETRLVLQEHGWACRPTSADERRAPAVRRSAPPFVVASWHCLEGLRPIKRATKVDPPVPTARPIGLRRQPPPSWGDEPLNAAVRRDLAAIGQDEIGDGTSVEAALGDLDGDDIDDAVVILTREAEGAAPHRMLMAYLRNGDGYNLVDVWILKLSEEQNGERLEATIENGAVRLEKCCADHPGPSTLILDDRKLTYADEG